MSLFPRFPAGEFTPLFRLLDDYASHTGSRSDALPTSIRSFQPNFDVQETKDAYVLHGELPGTEQKDIRIEFVDSQTLTISGRVERSIQRSSGPDGSDESSQSESAAGSYHKPTAEEKTSSTAPATSAPTESSKHESDKHESEQHDSEKHDSEKQVTTAPKKDVASTTPRYWVLERLVGEFHRFFTFPSPVNQDKVKATLKNGILTIVVPKAAPPSHRRIDVE